MNYYPSYNQYYNQKPTEQYQGFTQPYVPQYVPQTVKALGLQGKSVDNIEVVKAMDIPLDGTVSYFPLTDGTAIVSKQLQADGTSKTIIYKPVEEEQKEAIKYITIDELEDVLNEVQDLKDELKEMKKEFKKKSKEE